MGRNGGKAMAPWFDTRCNQPLHQVYKPHIFRHWGHVPLLCSCGMNANLIPATEMKPWYGLTGCPATSVLNVACDLCITAMNQASFPKRWAFQLSGEATRFNFTSKMETEFKPHHPTLLSLGKCQQNVEFSIKYDISEIWYMSITITYYRNVLQLQDLWQMIKYIFFNQPS